MIRSELTTCSNIKSKTTRKSVEAALHQILNHLPEHLPSQGVGVYACEDGIAMVVPDDPLPVADYICSKRFYVDILEALFRKKQDKVYGWLWWTGKEALYQDTTMQNPVRRLREGGGNKRHNKGGQSAPRFQRRFDNADAAWERDVAEWVGKMLSDVMSWVFIGGPGVRLESEPARKCQKTCGVDVHRSETFSGFKSEVLTKWIPEREIQWAKDQEAFCWDSLQRYPDKIKVGKEETVEYMFLLKRLWIEEALLNSIPVHDAVEIVSMPNGSLARLGGVVGELRYTTHENTYEHSDVVAA